MRSDRPETRTQRSTGLRPTHAARCAREGNKEAMTRVCALLPTLAQLEDPLGPIGSACRCVMVSTTEQGCLKAGSSLFLMRRRLLHGWFACCTGRPGGRRELHLLRGAAIAAAQRAKTAQTNHGDGGRCLSADSPATRLAQLARQRDQTPGNHDGTHTEQMVQRCWNEVEHQPLRGATRGRFTALSTAATKSGAASGTAVTARPLGVGTACQQVPQRPGEQTCSEGDEDRRSFLTTPRTGIGTAVPRGTNRGNNQSGQIAGEQYRFVHSLREICDDLRTGTYQRVPLINVRSRPPLKLRPWNRQWKRKRA